MPPPGPPNIMRNEREIYSEETHSVTVAFLGRADDIRFTTRRGTAVRAVENGIYRQTFSAAPGFPETKPPAELAEAASTLLQLARSAFAVQNENLQAPYVSATLTSRRYQVAHGDGEPVSGVEQSAEILATWNFLGNDGKRENQWERARGSIRGLIEEVQSAAGLAPAVKASMHAKTRWPAPRGSVPVLWSARAVAKLQMLFLRAFEGDRVLRGHSFLTESDLRDLAFTLEDRPPAAGEAFDHEGSPRRIVTLLRDGRPTALACNRRVAEELEVTPTGHARRQTFENVATVGFWHPHLEGLHRGPALLPAMDHGISVHDFEVLHFDSASGEIELQLNAVLVHHGAEGEALEPIALRVALLELMGSLREFEETRLTTGLAVGKQSQRVFSEVTAGRALSRPLLIPGSVPLHHYW